MTPPNDLVALTPVCVLCHEPCASGIHSRCYFERLRRTPPTLVRPPVRELAVDCLVVLGAGAALGAAGLVAALLVTGAW
jgi:hypothetical protein